MVTSVNVGCIRPNYKGRYDSTLAYAYYDAVIYSNVTYLCTSPTGSEVGTLPTDTTKWIPMMISGGLPIGTIYAYSGTDVPEGALFCDGQTIVNCDQLYPDFYTWVTTKGSIAPMTGYETTLTSYGDQCGFYGVDETAKTVRLPKLSEFIGGTTDVANFGLTQLDGLPNIVGEIVMHSAAQATPVNSTYGAFTEAIVRAAYRDGGTSYATSRSVGQINLDASKSSAVYGRTASVTPKSVRYPYIVQVYNQAVQPSVAQVASLNNVIDKLRSDVPSLAANAAMPYPGN